MPVQVDQVFWDRLDETRRAVDDAESLYDEMATLMKDTQLLSQDFAALLAVQRLAGAWIIERKRVVGGMVAKLTQLGVSEADLRGKP